ncbi:MAG: hypothetical protein M1831_007324 [Alyxoria varia]|nr:MAG: hypothetical protein M1831_007324 [Alyxoria varia]
MPNPFRSEGQMDFEYDNNTGPIGKDSPFAKLLSAQAKSQSTDSIPKKRSLSDPKMGDTDSKREEVRSNCAAPANSPGNAGTHGLFATPSKQQQQPFTNSHLMNSKHPSLSSQTPAHHGIAKDIFQSPSFTTPRHLNTESPSSGPETSPENTNADNSEITPENTNKTTGILASLGGAANASRRDSLVGSRAKPSPGRGEVPRGSYQSAVHKRVTKQRKQHSDRRIAQYVAQSETDDDSEPPQPKRSRNQKQQPDYQDVDPRPESKGPGFFTRLAGFLNNHPHLPHILSFYVQFALNVFLVGGFMWIIWQTFSTIRSDVDKKSEHAIAELVAEMSLCAKSYTDNRCGEPNSPPAMDSICANWKRCLNQDPRQVARAKVGAHTLSEIVNQFIEPISFKAFGFLLITALSLIFVSNLAFGKARDAYAQRQGYPQGYPQGQYPQTPGLFGSPPPHHPYWTPQQSPVANLPPQQSPTRQGRVEYDNGGLPQTPSRRRVEYYQ